MPDLTTQTTLSIETGTAFLGLGLMVGDQTFSRVVEVGRTAAERLPAELEALYAEAGQPLNAGRIVIGTGPGSYTGLRVGASYALGLGRAWGVPVLGVPTLEALVDTDDGAVAVSMDARKEQVYGAIYTVQSGVVTGVQTAPAKFGLTEFEVLSAGLHWRRGGVPDPLVLARNGLHHGRAEWELSYL
jgi:tRNA threonylcarbamoyladenosine biosynthesis protein TsaB